MKNSDNVRRERERDRERERECQRLNMSVNIARSSSKTRPQLDVDIYRECSTSEPSRPGSTLSKVVMSFRLILQLLLFHTHPEQLLSENKKLCAQYMRTGNCHYGPRCKYLHLRQPQHAMGEQQSGESLGDTSRDAEGRRPSSTTIIAENITLSTHNTQSDGISGVMASRLVESDLPPSLRPPPEGGYPPLPPIDWG
ncbi:hypothetical protein O6H91_06G052500 [Diphasiastrum complanatum]|uniref:Uncharacterized protein n=1 Tax=Diphasiastrum complanatum TaxID=34168 RepID=A0ACC2DE12_DIPCM|nr:hypothetical protein O6H91_06G052500 [Diphasiastrum complanatum]